MPDPRTAHWFERDDDSPYLEREEAADLTEYFELLLDNHTVEESIKGLQQMWPTVIFGEQPYDGHYDDGDTVVL